MTMPSEAIIVIAKCVALVMKHDPEKLRGVLRANSLPELADALGIDQTTSLVATLHVLEQKYGVNVDD